MEEAPLAVVAATRPDEIVLAESNGETDSLAEEETALVVQSPDEGRAPVPAEVP